MKVSTSTSTDVVSLEWCQGTYAHYQGPGTFSKALLVRVEGARDPQRVVVVYRDKDATSGWTELPLTLEARLPDTSRLFALRTAYGTAPQLPENIVFYIKADFEKFSAYDSNGGSNYSLAGAGGPLLNVPVVLSHRGYYEGKLYGTIFLRNLSYRKRVRVFYSVDRCESFRCVEAEFAPYVSTGPKDIIAFPNSYNCEAWTFSCPLDASASSRSCSLFVNYECEGRLYYDLNYNRLYQVDLAPR